MGIRSGETFAVALKQSRVRAQFSVKGLAKRIGYSRPHLSNIELGHRRCPSELVPILDAVLQADGRLISAWEAEEEMRRRGLLFVAPAALGTISNSNMDPESEPDPITQGLHRSLLTRADAIGSSKLIGIDEIERHVYDAHMLYQRADYSLVARTIPPLITNAERHAVWPKAQGKPHRILAAANLAASKLAAKLGDSELAWILADRAMTSARQIEDVPLFAVASGQAAISLAKDPRRLSDAEALVQAAYDQLMASKTIDAKHISAQGNLLLINSTISSRLKQCGVADHCLSLATELSARLGHDGNQLWTAFGPTNVELHRIAAAVTSERPDRAIAMAERLDTSGLPDSLVSRRAQLHLDLAAAYHQTRSGDASAVRHLIEAERIAPQVIRLNHNAKRLLVELARRERRSVTPGLRPLAQRSGVDI